MGEFNKKFLFICPIYYSNMVTDTYKFLSLRKHVRQFVIYESQYFTLDTAILLCRISLYKITFLSFGSRGPQWDAAAKQQGLFQDYESLKRQLRRLIKFRRITC
jgi:hypothetical protein